MGGDLQVTAEVIYNTVQSVLYCCIVYFACGEALRPFTPKTWKIKTPLTLIQRWPSWLPCLRLSEQYSCHGS